MPNWNGMGPRGEGPLTGRGLGMCSDSLGRRRSRRPYGFGRGLGYGLGYRRGLGFGLGRGRGRRFW